MKILIICRQQFGYLGDIYSYCIHLSRRHEIIYLDLNFGRPEITISGIRVIHVSRKGGRLARHLRFIRKALRVLRTGDFDLCLVAYFPGCFLLKLLYPAMRYVLDIRSGSTSTSRIRRKIYNLLIRPHTWFFRYRVIISRSLKDHLGIRGKTEIVPVGAESILSTPKSFDDMRLLYVGTLRNRNIEMTVQGLKQYLDARENSVPVSYTILGDGVPGQLEDLRQTIRNLGLDGVVSAVGNVPHDQLQAYFDRSNMGVSFVPVTEYYNCQPPTKTFEYLLSGLPVIATSTYENSRIITDDNGILIPDTPEGFRDGLEMIFQRLAQFDSGLIVESSGEYRWSTITGRLDDYLSGIVSAG